MLIVHIYTVLYKMCLATTNLVEVGRFFKDVYVCPSNMAWGLTSREGGVGGVPWHSLWHCPFPTSHCKQKMAFLELSVLPPTSILCLSFVSCLSCFLGLCWLWRAARDVGWVRGCAGGGMKAWSGVKLVVIFSKTTSSLVVMSSAVWCRQCRCKKDINAVDIHLFLFYSVAK